MRILYGVNGEGMGHATRSEVVIGALLGEHDVRVMASGAAFGYLDGRLGHVSEIFGPSFAMDQGEIHRWASVTHTIAALRRELPASVRRWLAAVHEWRPDVVVTDFEPLSGIYARSAHVPLVCVDNIHMIDSCHHDDDIVEGARDDFRLARAVTRAMVPPAGDYVITTFFRPRLLRERTDLVPPIVRPAIVAARPLRGEHLLVYSGGSDALIEALRDCGMPCRVYGMRDGEEVGTTDGAIEYRARSVDGFLADLMSARGVVIGSGFSLLSEAVYLGKPVLSVPLRDLLTGLRGLPTPPPRFYERWAERAGAAYLRATRWPGFRPLVTTVFALWVLSGLVLVLGAVFSVAIELGTAQDGYASDALEDLNFLNVATTVCYLASTVCVVLGLARLRRDRIGAYRWFERALLVAVLLTHVFIFVESQFGAVFGVGRDILLLLAVRSMIHAEEGRPGQIPTLMDHPATGLTAPPPLAAPGAPPADRRG